MTGQDAVYAYLQANFKRAYGQFNDDILEGCAKQTEFRAIVFALAYFHAALLERKKFGVGNLPGARSGPEHAWTMLWQMYLTDLPDGSFVSRKGVSSFAPSSYVILLADWLAVL